MRFRNRLPAVVEAVSEREPTAMRRLNRRARLAAIGLGMIILIAGCGSSEARTLTYSCPERIVVGESAAVLATFSGDEDVPSFRWVQETNDGGEVSFDAEPAGFRVSPISTEASTVSRREITGVEPGAVTLRVEQSAGPGDLALDDSAQSGCQVIVE